MKIFVQCLDCKRGKNKGYRKIIIVHFVMKNNYIGNKYKGNNKIDGGEQHTKRMGTTT
jgi:hypothetical protein